MNSAELMLGDYVKFSTTSPDYKKFGDKPFKVSTINSDGAIALMMDNGSYWVDEENIEPIPITEEFLLKNGFVKESFVDSCIYASDDNRITFDAYSPNYPRKWYVHVDNEDFASIGGCDLDYVHQLQQFLNICGIKKEWKL